MRSQPANAATSARSVERGRWKFVSSASTTPKRWPGRMKSAAAPGPARSTPSMHADSSARTLLVPPATTRPPRARAPPTPPTSPARALAVPVPPAAGEVDALAAARRAAHQHLPLTPLPPRRDEEDLDAPPARPPPVDPRRHDARVVQDEHVAGAQEAGQVGDARVA